MKSVPEDKTILKFGFQLILLQKYFLVTYIVLKMQNTNSVKGKS